MKDDKTPATGAEALKPSKIAYYELEQNYYRVLPGRYYVEAVLRDGVWVPYTGTRSPEILFGGVDVSHAEIEVEILRQLARSKS